MRKFLVAISSTVQPTAGARRLRVNEAYVRAVEQAGLVPVVVPPFADPADTAAILDAVDGLVLTGGEDVNPAAYGASPHPALGPTNQRRDATEIALTLGARERRTPTLAICRGIQVANVAFGGTLIQDIPSERPGSLQHNRESERSTRVHEVAVTPASALERALGASALTVNSFHHQAVDRPAGALRVTAKSPDGIIEGMESADPDWWMLAVQWHPEDLTETTETWDRGLFAALQEAIASSRSAKV